MSALAKALAAAQSEFPAIERSRDVTVKTKTGGSYTFSYSPHEKIVEAVEPVLARHGLSVSQLLGNIEGKPALRTILLHEDGEQLEDSFPLPANGGQTAQEYGSLITYFRRYALVAVLGLATEDDDDGNHASGHSVSAARRTDGDHALDDRAAAEAQHPSEVVLHWSRNKGKKLGDLTEKQLRWYAEEWKLQDNPTEYDHLVKASAIALLAGDDGDNDRDPYPDVPFV